MSTMNVSADESHSLKRIPNEISDQGIQKSPDSSPDNFARASSESDSKEFGNNALDHDQFSVLDCITSVSAIQNSLKSLEYFVRLLQNSGIEGPVEFITDPEKLGHGAQFNVYKQKLVWPGGPRSYSEVVAVKEPKYIFESHHKLDLADPASRRQLHDMCLEIAALAHPTLRMHPNIITLLGWGHQEPSWQKPLVLVLELAEYDLKTLLEDKGLEMPWRDKYRICYQIGAGLDAIHECRMAHGDLKVRNVLICKSQAGPVAKIADFGFCVDEEDLNITQISIGTPGWQAPEVEDGNVQLAHLPLADNYSYGLLIWSVMLLEGNCPPRDFEKSRSTAAVEAFQSEENGVLLPARQGLICAVESLLDHRFYMRPRNLSAMMQGAFETRSASDLSSLTDDEASSEDVERSDLDHGVVDPYEWELPALSSALCRYSFTAFEINQDSVQGDLLFNMALKYSQHDRSPKNSLRLICISAQKDYEPAQALLELVSEYLEKTIPEETACHLDRYLENSVATGSFTATSRLRSRNYKAFEDARQVFRRDSGFNLYYSDVSYESGGNLDDDIPTSSEGRGSWHWVAVHGSLEHINQLGCANDRIRNEDGLMDINSLTSYGETALYLSCLRGAWEVSKALLDYGADPSIRCTAAGLTCLHWLFAFDDEEKAKATDKFIEQGANINELSNAPIPMYHFPFTLPQGSPLHWAVTVQCHATIKVLLDNGADPSLRNGSDPYEYDDRIRPHNFFRDPDSDSCSISKHSTLGLTPLDIAAMIRDPFIFQHLQSGNGKIDLNVTDEEGLALMHRLSFGRQDRTMLGNLFDRRVFQGSPKVQHDSLETLLSTIITLGADVDMPVKQLPQYKANDMQYSEIIGYTPLMLAMGNGEYDLVELLINHGATVQYKNQHGVTALMCLSPHYYIRAGTERGPVLHAMKMLINHGGDIHSADNKGRTAIRRAAYPRHIPEFEFLLEQGADPGSQNSTMWKNLSSIKNSDKIDFAVADLLGRYVFSLEDPDKRYQIMEIANKSGPSLLHYFSRDGSVACVTALLNASCVINARWRRREYPKPKDGKWVKIEWDMTPLDAALAVYDQEVSVYFMAELSDDDRGNVRTRLEKVISLLRNAGGIELRQSSKVETEFVDEDARAREIKKFPRNFFWAE